MNTLLLFIVSISLILVFYSYLLYPWFIARMAASRKINRPEFNTQEFPTIALVFSAYNEEKVIVEKLKNLDALDYPNGKLHIHVGLDSPDDQTAQLIAQHLPQKHAFTVHHFTEREGKANVLNKIFNKKIQLTDYDVVVMMDANIIAEDNCLVELVKYFKNPAIGLVGAVIRNELREGSEIAPQERFYIAKESQIKVDEGQAFDATIGAFGACYAIRSNYIKVIPPNFLMEDFYLSLHVLEEGGLCVTNPQAIVYEDIPGTVREEFKRKRRISAGNFQNLSVYQSLIWRKPWPVGFAFFSHKVLRWLTPFFLIAAIVSASLLILVSPDSTVNRIVFALMLFNLILPLIDLFLNAMNISVNLLRLHRYFLSMNIAMLLGFIDWTSGVKTNIWKPTKRL